MCLNWGTFGAHAPPATTERHIVTTPQSPLVVTVNGKGAARLHRPTCKRITGTVTPVAEATVPLAHATACSACKPRPADVQAAVAAATAEPETLVVAYDGAAAQHWFLPTTRPVLAAADVKAETSAATREVTLSGAPDKVAAVAQTLRTVWSEIPGALAHIKDTDEQWKALPKKTEYRTRQDSYLRLRDTLAEWAGEQAEALL